MEDLVNPQPYNIFLGNSPVSYSLDPTLLDISTEVVCPELEMTVVRVGGALLDETAFMYDQASNEFTINTDDINHAGPITLKIVASFTETYTQKREQYFDVEMVDFCALSILTNPG